MALFMSDFHISENEGSITRNLQDTTHYVYQKESKNWIHKKVIVFLQRLDSIVQNEGKIQ